VLRRFDGHTAGDREWRCFSRFYHQIFAEKWGIATFNYPFFREVAQRLPDQVVLVLAELEQEPVAGALMYRSDTHLYGRHWGATQRVDSLHFEVCYYQGIEYCIEQGLAVFEPGAQGEHKVPRGFLPTMTRSSHWLADQRFRAPISHYVEQERQAVIDYMQELQAGTPYKRVADR
jgi:predicted N-acyltransferase